MKSSIPDMLGMNEEHSTPDVPVFEKDLGKAWGYACLLYTSPSPRDRG